MPESQKPKKPQINIHEIESRWLSYWEKEISDCWSLHKD